MPTNDEWAEATAGFRRLQVELNTLVARYCVPNRAVTIKIERRDDGGLRIWSDEVMGLIVSGADPEQTLAKVWPALVALKADPK